MMQSRKCQHMLASRTKTKVILGKT